MDCDLAIPTKADPTERIFTVIGVALCSAIAFPVCFNYIGRRERGERPETGLALSSPPDPVLAPTDDLTFKDSDPRLLIEIKVLDESGIGPLIGIVLTNVGASEAQGISLGSFTSGKHLITFPENISMLGPGKSTHPIVPRVSEFGPLQMSDMIAAMMKSWDSPDGNVSQLIFFPAWAVYSDYRENKFRASWHFIFHPFLYQNWLHLREQVDTAPAARIGPYLTVSKITTERFVENRIVAQFQTETT